MQITVIRHLPTEWNKKTWLQGRQDIELSQVSEGLLKGIAVNQKVLHKLAPFDLVLASTLQRTHQTANLYGYTYELEGLLDELDFGPFEGVPKKNLIEKYGEVWFENPRELVLGESLKNLEKRIVMFLDKYQKYTNILAFGHGSWIRAMISYANYGDINQMNKIEVVNNACITLSIET
ncbi:putative phosphoglycerate mutase [Bacillus niacini]|jgi:broad specificity phosphatase PhoE|uniref:Phosphoglycerate mutase n=1 Tax=Neobacillus niacini TaxID=86668 RepID=A0A852TEF7_9BACI|nr:histidine phosphatase family protein [Neobacillus niacini]NYE07250.1 putative phosphoglycerate mutase [Neobacillus niacini]